MCGPWEVFSAAWQLSEYHGPSGRRKLKINSRIFQMHFCEKQFELFLHLLFGVIAIGVIGFVFIMDVVFTGCGKTMTIWPRCFQGETEEKRLENCGSYWKHEHGYDSMTVKQKFPKVSEDSSRGRKYKIHLWKKTKE